MIKSILQKHFDCIEKHFDCIDWHDIHGAYKDWGFMVIPLEGRPAREVDFDAFLFAVKTMLPSDAKLAVLDGFGIRMSTLTGEYSMIFASKNWPRGAEGSLIPRLHPIRLREARRAPSLRDRIIPRRFREYIKGVRCARDAGHSWRYSFYCGRAFRFLTTHGRSANSH